MLSDTPSQPMLHRSVAGPPNNSPTRRFLQAGQDNSPPNLILHESRPGVNNVSLSEPSNNSMLTSIPPSIPDFISEDFTPPLLPPSNNVGTREYNPCEPQMTETLVPGPQNPSGATPNVYSPPILLGVGREQAYTRLANRGITSTSETASRARAQIPGSVPPQLRPAIVYAPPEVDERNQSIHAESRQNTTNPFNDALQLGRNSDADSDFSDSSESEMPDENGNIVIELEEVYEGEVFEELAYDSESGEEAEVSGEQNRGWIDLPRLLSPPLWESEREYEADEESMGEA